MADENVIDPNEGPAQDIRREQEDLARQQRQRGDDGGIASMRAFDDEQSLNPRTSREETIEFRSDNSVGNVTPDQPMPNAPQTGKRTANTAQLPERDATDSVAAVSTGSNTATQSDMDEAIKRGMEAAKKADLDDIASASPAKAADLGKERLPNGIPNEISIDADKPDRKMLIPVDDQGKPMPKIEMGKNDVKLVEADELDPEHLAHLQDKNAPKMIVSDHTGSTLSPGGNFTAMRGKRDGGKAYAADMENFGASPDKPDASSKQNYKNLPPVLVAEKNEASGQLEYKAVKAKEFENLEDAKAKYPEGVQIKTPSGSYQSPDKYDQYHVPGKGADARFEQLKSAELRSERMADVYVLDKKTKDYVPLEKMKQEDPSFQVDKNTEIGIKNPGATAVLTKKDFVQKYKKDEFEAVMEKNGIDPDQVRNQYRADKADILIKDGDTLKNAANMDPKDLKNLDPEDVLIQNRGKKQNPTGNYTTIEQVQNYRETRGGRPDLEARLEKAGVTLAPKEGVSDDANTVAGVDGSRAERLLKGANENAPAARAEPMEIDRPAQQQREQEPAALTGRLGERSQTREGLSLN